MYSLRIYYYGNSLRVLYEQLPRTLRTPLISPNTPNTPYILIELNRVKHFEPLGLSYKLIEIDFNASQCSRSSRIEPIELLRGLYESNARDIWNGSNGSNRSNCSGGNMNE